jgi:hypothetical protein
MSSKTGLGREWFAPAIVATLTFLILLPGGALDFDRDGLTNRAITKKCYELSELYSVGFTIGKYGSCVEYHALSLPRLVPLSSSCYESLDTRRKPLQPFCSVRDRFRLIRLSQNAG